MKRPKIEDFFPEGTSLSDAMKEYKKSKVLFDFIQAQDQYIDGLEADILRHEVKIKWERFHESFLPPPYEECPNCFKKRPSGVICNFEICHIRLGNSPDTGHLTSDIQHPEHDH